jgi:hypothetical protein
MNDIYADIKPRLANSDADKRLQIYKSKTPIINQNYRRA